MIVIAEEFLTESQAIARIPRRESVARAWLRENVPRRKLDLYLLSEIRAALIDEPLPPEEDPSPRRRSGGLARERL